MKVTKTQPCLQGSYGLVRKIGIYNQIIKTQNIIEVWEVSAEMFNS